MKSALVVLSAMALAVASFFAGGLINSKQVWVTVEKQGDTTLGGSIRGTVNALSQEYVQEIIAISCDRGKNELSHTNFEMTHLVLMSAQYRFTCDEHGKDTL